MRLAGANRGSEKSTPEVEASKAKKAKGKAKLVKPKKAAVVVKDKKKSKVKPLIVFALVAVVLGVGGKYGYDAFRQYQRNQVVNQIALSADGIVSEVVDVLSAKAPTTWVYDRDENLIMTLKLSKTVEAATTLPDSIRSAVLLQIPDVPQFIAAKYMQENSIVISDESLAGYAQRLDSSFDSTKLLCYVASTESFGPYNGVVEASNSYFGVNISELNVAQLDFLCYTFHNDSVDIEQYCRDNNTTETRLGIVLNKSEFSAMRKRIIDELELIPGVDISMSSYMVKLSISSQQQSILQSLVDSNTRQLIDINSDGTYAINCSVAVADRVTGYLRAYIPGRASSGKNVSEFAMNTLSFRDNFAALNRSLMDADTFSFSLKEVQKPNGDIELRSLRSLFEDMALSETKSMDTVEAITMMRNLYATSNPTDTVSLVYQVTDSSGMTLYKASGNTPLNLSSNNLYQFFADEDNNLTYVRADIKLDTGLVSFKSTADYVAVILIGSGALGGSITKAQSGIIEQTVESLYSSIADFYPTPTSPLWSGSGMQEHMTNCYRKNQQYVEAMFVDMLDKLTTIEINSYSTRLEFETLYEEMMNFVNDYETYVGNTYAGSLRSALQEIRALRTELLVKFSV